MSIEQSFWRLLCNIPPSSSSGKTIPALGKWESGSARRRLTRVLDEKVVRRRARSRPLLELLDSSTLGEQFMEEWNDQPLFQMLKHDLSGHGDIG